MLISHESPLVMLEASRKYNDYDYALVHLFEEYDVYLQFFKDSLKQNRIVYLDNSIFELGEAFDSHKFAKYCEEFYNLNKEKFYHIVPDVMQDCDGTIQKFKEFKTIFDKENSIGVVHGKTLEERLKCFEFMKENADIIAIGFDSLYYEQEEGKTVFEKWYNGRIKFVNYLNDNGYLKNTKVHLLGCGLPQEFKAYKHIKEIISVDTSNPIVHGLKGISYNENGLDYKETQKLIELIEFKEEDIKPKLPIIEHNITKFRSFCER